VIIEAIDSFDANMARTAQGKDHINTLVLTVLRIRLFDPFEYAMPRAPFRLKLGPRTIEGKADDDAWVEIRVVNIPEKATIEWGEVDDEEEEIPQGSGYPSASDVPSEEDAAAKPKAPESAPAPQPKKKSDSINYLYEREIHLQFDDDEQKAAEQRLHNLGYNVWQELERTVRAFQLIYNKELTGKFSDIKSTLWDWHDDCGPNTFPKLDVKDKVK
jgi:hypothetical protein